MAKDSGPTLDVKLIAFLLVINAVVNISLVVAVLLGIIPQLGVVMRPPLSHIGRYGFYALTIFWQSLQLWVGLGIWGGKRTAAKLGVFLAAGSMLIFYFTNLGVNIPINAFLAAYFLYLLERPDFQNNYIPALPRTASAKRQRLS